MIENDKIEKILVLLKTTFSGETTIKIYNAQEELNQIIENDIQKYIKLFIYLLSLKSINNYDIPLELHMAIVLYLKKLFSYYNKDLDSYISFYLKDIITLLITNSININLNRNILFNNFLILIEQLLYSNSIINDYNNLKNLFNLLYNYISLNHSKNDIKINIKIIMLNNSFMKSKAINKENFLLLFNEYYLRIYEEVENNIIYFINISNKYNGEIIHLLKYFYKGLNNSILKMNLIFNQKQRKEISLLLFNKYNKFSLNLIKKICSIFNNKSNDIIIYINNNEECNILNNMLSKIFKFMILILNTLYDDRKEKIKNEKEITYFISEIIKLIINSFEYLLYNKEKYYFIRNIKNEINERNNGFYKFLSSITSFLKISLFIKTIKDEFSNYVLKFLFNILFPLIITLDKEKNFMEDSPQLYQIYFNEIINNESNSYNINFRLCVCSLIIKIFEECDVASQNDILLTVIKMFKMTLNYEINKDINIKDNFFNLEQNKKHFIDLLNSESKIDLSLLILVLLRHYLIKNKIYRKDFINYIIINQEKLQSFKSKLIIIKICVLYKVLLPFIFYLDDKCINLFKYESFIDKALCFLFNNIQDIKAVSNISLNIIIELIEFLASNDYKNSDSKELCLFKKIFFNSINNYFKYFYNIIILNNIPLSFYILCETILKNIKINDKDYIFLLLNNLVKQVIPKLSNFFVINNDQFNIYTSQILNIFIQFLEGENNIILSKEEELIKFNNIFLLFLSNINDSIFDLYFEQIVKIIYLNIKITKTINIEFIYIMKKILIKIEEEKEINKLNYSFSSIFTNNININNISKEIINQNIILIINTIHQSYSFQKELSINYTLLLTIQIINEYINDLGEDILRLLLNDSFNSYNIINKNDNLKEVDIINNILILTIISLCFIFAQNKTFNILTEKENEKKETKFEEYLIMLRSIIEYDYYNIILGKCLLLGLYSILKNNINLKFIEAHNIIVNMLEILTLIFFYHKNKIKDKDTVTNKEIENNELNNSRDEENDEINNHINYIFKNSLINKYKETELFYEIIRYFQINEKELFNELKRKLSFINIESINDLC